MRTELQERTDILANQLQRSVDVCFEVLRSLSQLYQSSNHIGRQDFQRFVQPALQRHLSIHALEWLPRLMDQDRLRFEQAVQTEGYPDFQITERSPEGKIVRAERRLEYLPVHYVEPLASNQLALGFDLASDVTRRSALEQARDTGAIAVSGRIELVQESHHQFGFLVILPIYWHGAACHTVSDRRQALRGCMLGVLRMADIVRSSLAGLNLDHIDFYLYDRSSPPKDGLLAIYESRTQQVIASGAEPRSPVNPSSQAICTRSFAIANRQWSLVVSPTAAYVDRAKLYQQSQMRADAATAEAETLKQALHNLQQTQARWFWEKNVIAIGVGMILLILGSSTVIASRQIPHPSLLRPLEEGRSPQLKGSSLPEVPRSVPLAYQLALLVSTVLSMGVFYLLQRQAAERHQVEAALYQANSQLEIEVQKRTAELTQTKEISELKLRLFSMVSHEFRTPLSTILVSSQLLSTQVSTKGEAQSIEKQEKNVLRIQSAAKTMAQLLGDILILGRAEAGKLEFRPEWLDLPEFCQQVIDEVHISTETQQRIDLRVENPLTQAHVDRKLLHSILSNLLGNAIKYSSPHSPVQLLLHSITEAIVLEVKDEGIGIATEEQHQLYEVFHRGTNVGNIEGTGLGLAVVKTCVDLHQGQITVNSAIGQGTTFTVTLPQ